MKGLLLAPAIWVIGCGASTAPPARGEPRPATIPVGTANDEDAGVPISGNDPSWGSRTARVTIVEFADLECPFCARAEPVLQRMRDKYGPDKLRIVWKNDPLPFHPNARPAAEAAAGVFALAGSEAFWRFRALLAKGPNDLSELAIETSAVAAGLRDVDGLRTGLRARRWAAKVDADLAEAKQLGAVGTPWFFINGIEVVGAQPGSVFEGIIDGQLLAAEDKISGGVPLDRVYAVLSRENLTRPHEERSDPDGRDADQAIYQVPIANSPARGGPQALVTIVEFADYECAFCARAEVTLRELRSEYGDSLRIVVKDVPLAFHALAEPAAEAALEVRAEKGDTAFWAMHDALYEHQDDLSEAVLVRLAQGQGASAEHVRAAIEQKLHSDKIDADSNTAADFGVNGTPQFFIDGRRLVGAQPKERFVAVINEEMTKARALIAAGTDTASVYAALTKDGVTAPEPQRKESGLLPSVDPARGPLGAKVIIHEFADFQCSYCVRAEATLGELEKLYGTKIRFVWHDFPLPVHEDAMPAARAAREAQTQRGNRGFWQLHDRLMRGGGRLSRTDLDEHALALGLDMKRWKDSFDNNAHDGAIDDDRRAAAALGFTGTPSFLVVGAGASSGYVIVGAQSVARFRRLVDRAMAEAK